MFTKMESMMESIRKRNKDFRVIFPAIIIVLVLSSYTMNLIFNTDFQPYKSYDPEYAYFMDSLVVFKGIPYTYADHPGTPVSMLGTFFYLLNLSFSSE